MPNKKKQAGGKSPEPLKIETVDVASLIADPSNVRKHSQKNLDAIKGSLTKFGAQKPIVVDAKGVVIAGNGTLEAAKSLGWKTIPIVRTGLTGVDATAFAIADNRTAELAEWDMTGLGETLHSLRELDFDLSAIGFDTSYLDGENAGEEYDPSEQKEPGLPKLIIEFKSEDEQRMLFLELRDRGFKVKA